MGVLLYALLCGFLPFDDENVTKLYRKIQVSLFISIALFLFIYLSLIIVSKIMQSAFLYMNESGKKFLIPVFLCNFN